MAYTISVCDTHRIPYPNATVKAYKLGSAMKTTDQIKFKHGKNGPELGFEIKTNARGYFCDNNGDLYTNGVFVTEDAIIKVTMADGTSTTWEVAADNDTKINDGKLYGTRTKDSADDDLVVKWSANAAGDYTLDYDDLIHKPKINEWMEVEQVVMMEQANDSIDVDKYCKTMTITCEEGVAPAGWSFVGGSWQVADSSKPNGEWCITLRADKDRVAQVVCVRNWTPWRLGIKNVQGQIIAVLDPTASDMGKFVTLYGTTEPTLPYHGTLDIEKLASSHPIVFGAGVLENTATNPIVIDDYTPDTMLVKFEAAYNYTGYPVKLFLKSGVTKSRVIKLWLQNFKTDKGLIICDAGNSNAVIGIIANFTVVDLIVSPDGLVKVSDYVQTQGTQLALDGSKNQTLPPEATFIVGSTDDNYFISTLDDNYTDKMIYGLVTNTSAYPKNLRLSFNGNEVVLGLLPGVTNSFVVHKMGTQYCVIKPTSGTVGNKYFVLTATTHDSHDFYYKVSKTVNTQDTINVNIPFLMQMHGESWGYFGGSGEHDQLVFDLSDLVEVGQSVTLRFKVDAYTKSYDDSIKAVYIGFGTDGHADFSVIPLAESVQNYTLCVARKTIVATVTRGANGYSATYGVEDTQV